MRELSLFTGGGGGVYGTKLLGWTTVGYVEWDEYCQQVIAARIRDGIFDYAPIFTDIRLFATEWASKYRGLVDVITAGFPCQPFSTAGKQKGKEDERNMWPSTLDVIRVVQPQWCLLENVPGLLGKHRYFETILKDLSEAGYDAKWTCLSAAEVGAPHKRERLWIMAHSQSFRCKKGRETGNLLEANGRSDGSLCSISSCSSVKSKNLADSESHRSSLLLQSTSGAAECERQARCNASGDSSGNYRGWWTTEPSVGRVANGVANGRDRLKALGNGQVPTVVKTAWEILNE
jgi:DNA (cytosine-5)-methyltransferase 1